MHRKCSNCALKSPIKRVVKLRSNSGPLFHHQISTGIVNVKFWEVNVDLLPGSQFHRPEQCGNARKKIKNGSETTDSVIRP